MADADSITRLNAALEGRYRIERELGAGGMATVYLAEDVRHHRNVALKVLKPELAAAVGAARFLAEIETTAKLQHPNILPLFDSGEADGLLFYVMPYVEGESLRDRLDREHQLPVDDAVRIAGELAEALDHAHRQGIVHRDIKPANVLLRDGRPLISDFGIALALSAGGGSRLTETGLSLGTPHYMSPEQVAGDARVGPSSDLWALGCVLYEMLVGEPPYTGSTPRPCWEHPRGPGHRQWPRRDYPPRRRHGPHGTRLRRLRRLAGWTHPGGHRRAHLEAAGVRSLRPPRPAAGRDPRRGHGTRPSRPTARRCGSATWGPTRSPSSTPRPGRWPAWSRDAASPTAHDQVGLYYFERAGEP